MINPTQEQVDIIKNHRNNMINYKMVSQSRLERSYYPGQRNGYLTARQNELIKMEVRRCDDWIEEYETKRIEKTLHENIESDLRLYLVKQFIGI